MLDYRLDDGAQALDQQQLLDWQRGWQVIDASSGSNLVSAPTSGGLAVDIDAGDVNAGGTTVTCTSATDFSLPAADPDQPRTDVIYRDANGDVQVKEGVPGQVQPAGVGARDRDAYAPSPHSMHDIDGVVLATVWVEAGATSITSADIRDRRLPATLDVDLLIAGAVEDASSGNSYDIDSLATGALSDSGSDNADGGDQYQLPAAEDSIDLQGTGDVENAATIDAGEVNNVIQVPESGSLQAAFDAAERHDRIEIHDDITLTQTTTLETDDVTVVQTGGNISVDVGTANDGIVAQPGPDSVRKGIKFHLRQISVGSGRHGVYYDTCVRNCEFRGATGGHSGDSGGYLFRADGSWGITVANVQPQGGTGGGGVLVDGGHNAEISSVLCKAMAGDGLIVQNCIAPNIISCDGETCGGDGIIVDDCPGATVIGPYTEANTGDGLVLDGDSAGSNRPFEVSTWGGRHKDNGGAGVRARGIRDSSLKRFHYSGNTDGALVIESSAVRVDYAIRDDADVTDNGSSCSRTGYDQNNNRHVFSSGVQTNPLDLGDGGPTLRDNFGGASGQFRFEPNQGTYIWDIRDSGGGRVGRLAESGVYDAGDDILGKSSEDLSARTPGTSEPILAHHNGNDANPAGYYWWDGSAWQRVGATDSITPS